MGDALLAGHSIGIFEDLTKAAMKTVRIKETIQPNQEWVKRYEKLYPYYVTMYRHLDEDLQGVKRTLADL